MAKVTAKPRIKAPAVKVKTAAKPATATRLRVVLAAGVFLGPGKGELLERIAATGSISAAGRAMGMSYKRAWQLVETLNGYFRAPLVQAATGGKAGGGAQLTAVGRQVLVHYQAMTAATEQACRTQIAALHRLRRR